MNVNLTPELEELVHEKVESGLYNSASEVVRDALRLLKEQDQLRELRLAEIREKIAEGLKAIEDGRTVPLDEKLVADIKTRGRQDAPLEKRQF